MLLRFARKSGFGDRLNIVSLGQGQGPYAKSLIDNGIKSGEKHTLSTSICCYLHSYKLVESLNVKYN